MGASFAGHSAAWLYTTLSIFMKRRRRMHQWVLTDTSKKHATAICRALNMG
jgi:hypothetical protein